jgi:hypothetical protein
MMPVKDDKPSPFPVRHLEGRGWQVCLAPEETWLDCHSEHDARTIAQAAVLEYEALEEHRSGKEFVRQLELLADALQRYRIGFGSRFFRRRAEEARRAGGP